MNGNKKRWFTETRYVDIDTGEELSKSRVLREYYIKVGSSHTTKDCGAYMLKIHTHEYRENPQQRIQF